MKRPTFFLFADVARGACAWPLFRAHKAPSKWPGVLFMAMISSSTGSRDSRFHRRHGRAAVESDRGVERNWKKKDQSIWESSN
ncbi:hypothetical protein LY76DRAFT_124766 [Colletotrichum caudatum]|nr:hypothetical protein LY76DRAFT_124766 [Colletotrichum caudatum]